MPTERLPPDDPGEWLNRARSNLAYAHTVLPGTYLEDPCFQAQQAAEKAVKAVLIAFGVEFPYSHNLGHLLDLVSERGVRITGAVADAAELTKYAVVTRYPGVVGPLSEAEYRRAAEIATAVVRWAEAEVGAKR